MSGRRAAIWAVDGLSPSVRSTFAIRAPDGSWENLDYADPALEAEFVTVPSTKQRELGRSLRPGATSSGTSTGDGGPAGRGPGDTRGSRCSSPPTGRLGS